MGLLKRVTDLAPEVEIAIYDKKLRGKHIDAGMQELGILILTGVTAAVAGQKKSGQASGRAPVPKVRHIENRDLILKDGRVLSVAIVGVNEAAGILELTESGEPYVERLARLRTQRRGRRGNHRFYNEYRRPEEYGGGILRLRLTCNAEDKARGLNRAENLRAIPPGDPDFERIYPRREDIESINRGLKDSLHLGKAHSIGHLAHEVDLLGWALGVNALTWFRLQKKKAVATAA